MTADFDELLEINRLRVVVRVVSNASHDINNALQVIGGSAEMLGTRSTLGPLEQRRVQAIAAQTERIATILDRLSSITRQGPGAGGRQSVELAQLAEEAVALRAFALGRARIAVTVDRLGLVSCPVSADRWRILQVFLNLLLNLETVLANTPGASLRVTFERAGGDWVVSFIDNGPGLDPAARMLLASGAPPPAVGPGLTGMGLWVSARIAEQHGGRLEAGDQAGAGAVIRLTIPASG